MTSEYEFRDGISTSSRFVKAGGYMLKVPAIDIAEVGAGGGSIAGIDKGGLLVVGPQSAGAVPGPACYGLGNDRPTVTDANVVLGFINATSLAGGNLNIDRKLSEAADRRPCRRAARADAARCGAWHPAVANAAMARAVRAVTVERGRDPRDLTLMAFGGNGGVHAPDLARQLGIPRVVVPPMSGIFSALGMLASDIEHTALKTVSRHLDRMEVSELKAIKDELQSQVARQLAGDGYQAERTAFLWEADLRHEGQATELTVPFEGEDFEQIRERFVAEYFKTYGYRDATPIELMKVRVAGRGLRENRLEFSAMKIAVRQGASRSGTREVSFARGERAVTVDIVDRSAVGASPRQGPLIIEEFDATIVVPPDARVHKDAIGCIVLEFDAMKVDPITFAVIKSGLDSIADDMAYTVVRIARSEIVKDVMDFSAALCAGDGQMVAQAKTIAQHLGAIPEAMASVLAKFEGDLHDGDVVIMNDPYHGGMHLPDIFMFVPIFHGGKRRAFAVVICHHTDVGGRVPGSNASNSTEIYQEGLRIPPLKLYDRGVLNTTLETLIKINVRVPDRVWGDLSAQFAAAQVGKRGLEKLMQRYGADDVDAYMQELLDYAERLTREEIRTWPKGTYSFTDYIDNDGFSDAPIPIKVAITVNGDGTSACRLHRLLAAGEGRAELDAQLHAFADLSQRALRAAEGRAEQCRPVPLRQGEGAGSVGAQSGDAGRRARRARSPATACSTPCSARWRRSCRTRCRRPARAATA